MANVNTSKFLPRHNKLSVIADGFTSGNYSEQQAGQEPGKAIEIKPNTITVIQSSTRNRDFSFCTSSKLVFIQEYSEFEDPEVVDIEEVTVEETDDQTARALRQEDILGNIVVVLKRIEAQLEKVTEEKIDSDDID